MNKYSPKTIEDLLPVERLRLQEAGYDFTQSSIPVSLLKSLYPQTLFLLNSLRSYIWDVYLPEDERGANFLFSIAEQAYLNDPHGFEIDESIFTTPPFQDLQHFIGLSSNVQQTIESTLPALQIDAFDCIPGYKAMKSAGTAISIALPSTSPGKGFSQQRDNEMLIYGLLLSMRPKATGPYAAAIEMSVKELRSEATEILARFESYFHQMQVS